jgi:integrase/recombinase XerD
MNDTILDRYVQHMNDRGLAATSIVHRLGEVRRWLAWTDGRWQRATRTDVESFLRARPGRKGERMGPAARATSLSHLRAFYRWGVTEYLVKRDPTLAVATPRRPHRLPRPIREVDLALAFTAAEGLLRTCIGLGALAGLRCAEMAGLRWDDVDLVLGELRVIGKGGRERVIPLHPQLLELLIDLPRDHPHVLGRAYTAHHISRVVAHGLRGLGVDATAHQLRHRFGTVAYRNAPDHDVLAVAQVMGHASSQTTQIYAEVAPEAAAAVVAAMPRIGV